MDRFDPPQAVPAKADRAAFDAALSEQVAREKALTHHGDQVSAARRRLPMVQVPDYTFSGPDGPLTLTELFDGRYQLMVQNFMFDPSWSEGCPSCTWAVDNLPANMRRLRDAGVAFAMISQAPIEKLQAWSAQRGWDHLWVSSFSTNYHYDWGWTQADDEGHDSQRPGYSYYLLSKRTPFLTYMTTARGTEAILPVAHIMDRTCYGRQEDWEDSPEGWPQYPTYG
jgi:predicted dithiol-disulfide oxidoreductase (DUF899 family)